MGNAGPLYKTDALGNVKDAKNSWLLGKTAQKHPNTKSFRTSLTSLASLAEVTD
jgi:hypothetical protein